MPASQIDLRSLFAIETVTRVADRALKRFHARESLTIESKGMQDWVSEADRAAEDQIRQAIEQQYPDDAVIGEERDYRSGNSGYTWVIDPIDGTSLFVNGIPGWCVVLACVHEERTVVGVVLDPIAGECFSAACGRGAMLNGQPIQVSAATALDQGSVAVGHSLRVGATPTLRVLDRLLSNGGMFYRSGSGAMNLVYVAAGRLIGYVEPHMNAWDCLAALLIIEEAGGRVRPFDMADMLANGDRVVAAPSGTFDTLMAWTQEAYG